MKKFQQLSLSLIACIIMLGPVRDASCQEGSIALNENDYFETRGFNVFGFDNAYEGFFFDEKTSGIMLIHHGVRTATGGAVRLKPTPEQWDQIPVVLDRRVNREDNTIDIELRYEDFHFNSLLRIRCEGKSIIISVLLDEPLPRELEGRVGFNLEFLPAVYFEKTFLMDGKTGIFPLHPSSSMRVRPSDTQLRQFAGHSTFDDRGRSEYVEPEPFAEGTKLILSPEDPKTRIRIESTAGGMLKLLDGRSVAQNGWYVVRSLIPYGKSGKVVEWEITPTIIPAWTRTPVIGYSQVGYHPEQEKIAVIELDRNDMQLDTATIMAIDEKGEWIEKYRAEVKDWGNFYRYRYARFDFSPVQDPGLYLIRYGKQDSGPFQIGSHIHGEGWHPTLDIWFPVQMDHMFVNEAYRVWHGAAHLDDAIQAPLNHQHFDGYRMGDTTWTKYGPGERIPGLNTGGWFDAGDFDIRTGSHSNTVQSLVESWDHFQLQRDETLIDQSRRYVDIHHPDGTPDLLQQIEHGTLALIAQHRAFGRAIAGIIVPQLHQYHHLGDGSTMTDNLEYNPALLPYESDGTTSGTPDDRWAFTMRMASNSYGSIAALASASRALLNYNDDLSQECIIVAERAWKDEQSQPVDTTSRRAAFSRMAGEIRASLQLYISSGKEEYKEFFLERIWPALEMNLNMNIGQGIRALPHMDQDFKDKLSSFVRKYKEYNDGLLKENPYGVPISTGGWAGNGGIIRWATTNYLLHQSFPEIIGPEYTHRGLSYLYGCHPCSNISFVSGIGVQSKKIAYGNNRADFSFIAGGVVPGVLLIKPDFPEHMTEWPFLWGENEYVIDICAEYIFLVNAANGLAREQTK
jgi:endoglucanase